MIKYQFTPKGNAGFPANIQHDILEQLQIITDNDADYEEAKDAVSVILGNDGSARGIMVVPDNRIAGKQIAEKICMLLIEETQSFRLDIDYMTGIDVE